MCEYCICIRILCVCDTKDDSPLPSDLERKGYPLTHILHSGMEGIPSTMSTVREVTRSQQSREVLQGRIVKGKERRGMKGRPKSRDSTFSTSMTTSPVVISFCLILRQDERSDISVSMLINTPFSSSKARQCATSKERRPYMPPVPEMAVMNGS